MYQSEIQFFWPLTEQMELDLDYAPTHIHFRAKGIAGVHSLPILGSVYEFSKTSFTTQFVLDVQSTTIRHETKPPLYRRLLYRLMGLKWDTK